MRRSVKARKSQCSMTGCVFGHAIEYDLFECVAASRALVVCAIQFRAIETIWRLVFVLNYGELILLIHTMSVSCCKVSCLQIIPVDNAKRKKK